MKIPVFIIAVAILALAAAVATAIFLWATSAPVPISYEWSGPVFPTVSKLTVIEVNSLDPDCTDCRATHDTIAAGMVAVGGNADYQFRIMPRPASFTVENSALIKSYNAADIAAYCLSPELGLASQSLFNKFLSSAFTDERTNSLDKLFIFPRQRTQLTQCVQSVGTDDLTLLEGYFEQFSQIGSAPVMLLQAPGDQPVVVQGNAENIANVFKTLQEDPNMILDGLQSGPE